ncbi:spore coat protein [Paenibacillus sp.]|uniref:spore coat protein n=1 Tax=Paenibacillus sp. TaxID=58172 RepID=UPI002D571B4A|nr:spore coat protein [Paenibacillus sp.]HZG87459.1 spore coat protein [Paenibacillus sp.]
MIPGMMERTAPSRRGGLPDAVLAGAILGELRQAVLMYMEAALEATTPDVRRLFERLGYDAARQHELLSSMMRQHALLEPGFPAPAQEVQRAASRAAEAARAVTQRAREPQAPHQAAPQAMHQAGRQAMPQAMAPQFAGAPTMRPAHVYAPPEPPRFAGYAPPQMGAQPRLGAQPGPGPQPAPRPPEFAQPHAMPFGGAPTAAYVPPQPQQQARSQAQQAMPRYAEPPRAAAQPPLTAQHAQPMQPRYAEPPAEGAKSASEAPPPMRDAEPAESSALREEASLQAQADAAEAAPPASVPAAPATKRPRRTKAAAAADTQAADAHGGESEQLTT